MGDSIRVLFVRSNIDTAKSIAASLEDATDTFDIEVESNAEAGLELLRTGTFDCVVSGYELPGRDGIGFLETVRERYQGLPFVLHTAQGNEAVAAAAISADVTEYVTEKASTDQDAVLASTIENTVGDSTTTIDAVVYDGTLREDDMIGGILVSSWEITERREQKHQIQQRRQQLSRLHEATRELLQSESPQQVAAAASQTAVDILDFSLNGIHFYDEAVDGLAPIAVSEGSRELFDEVPVIDEGIAWETFQSGEEHIYNDVGEASDLYNAESPIQSEATLPLVGHGVFIISATQKNAFTKTDIEFARILAANTEAALKRITKEQQLRTRETELEQQNERLEEFASIVSHDLRNPLNVAQGRADLLGDECDSEHLAPVEEALERMEELISDTLTLARQGKVVAETESIQLSNLVGECWNTVATDDATLETAEGVTFHGDRSRLQHVFENLFRNAIEHGGTGVTIRVGRIDDNGFYVEDTGPGIPKAARETVFEPGETSAADGTGFGLSIVKRTVEAHGWEVGVVAGSEGGARFEVTGIDMHDY